MIKLKKVPLKRF